MPNGRLAFMSFKVIGKMSACRTIYGVYAATHRPSRPALAPRFQHQHVPDEILPIARAAEVLMPVTADHRGIEQARLAQPLFVEQRLGPLAQRTAQPFAERNAKAHLRAFDQLRRNMTVEN